MTLSDVERQIFHVELLNNARTYRLMAWLHEMNCIEIHSVMSVGYIQCHIGPLSLDQFL